MIWVWIQTRKGNWRCYSYSLLGDYRRSTWWVQASRGDLVVPRFRFQTFGHRAFAVSGPKFGTLFRSESDNRVTIYCFSNENWKRICFSSSERFCGSISNERPYKFSILLLLGEVGRVVDSILWSRKAFDRAPHEIVWWASKQMDVDGWLTKL